MLRLRVSSCLIRNVKTLGDDDSLVAVPYNTHNGGLEHENTYGESAVVARAVHDCLLFL